MVRNISYLLIVLTALIVSGAVYGIALAVMVTSSNDSSSAIAVANQSEQALAVTEVSKPDVTQIVVMGDSIARGTGDETGVGIAGALLEVLDEQGIETSYTNAALDGSITTDLIEMLQMEASKVLIESADILILSIGGNDLRRITTRQAEYVSYEQFQESLTSYQKNLEQVFKIVRSTNPDVQIFHVGLYNPYNETSSTLLNLEQEYVEYFLMWIFETQRIIELDSNATYVPVHDIFKVKGQSYISLDGLHPNSQGYKSIAERIASYYK